MEETYRFGSYRLDVPRRALYRGTEVVPLTPRALDTLTFLVARRERAVSRQELLEAVWSDTVVEPGTVDKHVSMLRKALDTERGEASHIETVRGFGFRFAAPLAADVEPVVPAAPEDVPVPAAAPISGRRFPLVAVLTTVVVLAAVGVGFVLQGRAGPATPTIALVRFHGLAGEPDGDWRSTALREMVSAQLASAGRLHRVLSTDVDRALRELGQPASEAPGRDTIAALHTRLGADYVVTGSWVPSGEPAKKGIQVTAALEDARTRKTLATAVEAGTESDLFDVASHLATRLRERLDLKALTLDERRALRADFPTDPETSRLYAEALARLSAFETLAAVERLEQVIAREPDFAPAHESLSDAWYFLGVRPKARDEAAMALALSSRRPDEERRLAAAVLADRSRDGPKAIALYRALYETTHDFELGLRLVTAEIEFRRADDARRTLAELRGRPKPYRDDPRLDLSEGWVARELGDFKGQLAAGRKAAERGRAMGAGLLVAQARELESWALLTLGDEPRAHEAAEDGWRIAEALGNKRLAARCLGLDGHALSERDDAEALRRYERALALSREIGFRNDSGFLNGISQIHCARGDLRQARRVAGESLATSRDTKEDEAIAVCGILAGQYDVGLGELATAEAELAEALAASQALGIKSRLGSAWFGIGELRTAQGRDAEAREAFDKARDLYSGLGLGRSVTIRLRRAQLETTLGHPELALAEARAARAGAERMPNASLVEMARVVAAEALLESGRGDAAAEELRGVAVEVLPDVRGLLRFYPGVVRARVAAASGARAESLDRLDALARQADAGGNVAEALDARLARARLLAEPAERASALAQLARDSKARGFLGVARRAERSAASAQPM